MTREYIDYAQLAAWCRAVAEKYAARLVSFCGRPPSDYQAEQFSRAKAHWLREAAKYDADHASGKRTRVASEVGA